jgi:hypothetical protein
MKKLNLKPMNNQNNEEWKEQYIKKWNDGEFCSYDKQQSKYLYDPEKIKSFISAQLSKAEKRGEMRGLERAREIISKVPSPSTFPSNSKLFFLLEIEAEIKKLK